MAGPGSSPGGGALCGVPETILGGSEHAGRGVRRTLQPRHVMTRFHGFMIKMGDRNLRAGQAQERTEEWFNRHGLYRLRGTVRYPKAV